MEIAQSVNKTEPYEEEKVELKGFSLLSFHSMVSLIGQWNEWEVDERGALSIK